MATTTHDGAGSDPIIQIQSNGAGTDKAKVTSAGQIQMSDGSVAAPSASYLSDTNTGMYRSGTDQISFAVGGAKIMSMDSTAVQVTPSGLFDVRKDQAGADTTIEVLNNDNTSGTSNARVIIATGGGSSGDPFINFMTQDAAVWSVGVDNSDNDKLKIDYRLTSTGSKLLPGGGTPSLVIDTSGRVGIGTSSPGAVLDVYGNNPTLRWSWVSGGTNRYWQAHFDVSDPTIMVFTYTDAAGASQTGPRFYSNQVQCDALRGPSGASTPAGRLLDRDQVRKINFHWDSATSKLKVYDGDTLLTSL